MFIKTLHALFYKQRFFSTQPQYCLTFSWIDLPMLLRCCLIYIAIIILRRNSYLVYLCPCLSLGHFKSHLWDLYFSFSASFPLSSMMQPRLNHGAISYHILSLYYISSISYHNYIISSVFYLRQSHYNLRNFNVFATDNSRNQCLLNSSVCRANQLWQTLSSKIKDCASLQLFKDKIKTWLCDRCQCQIRSRYIANVVYF